MGLAAQRSPGSGSRPDSCPLAAALPRGGFCERTVFLAALWAALLLTAFGCKRYSDMSGVPTTEPVASSSGQFLDIEGAVMDSAWVGTRAASAAYVLIGEGHPVACDHLAQARVIRLMAEAGASPVIGLEMVSLDRQPVLDLFNKGLLGVDDLESNLDWNQTWGYSFDLYRPVFETARKYNLPLFALNIPREIARKAGKSGLKGLSVEERLGLPAKIIPIPKEQEESLREIFDSHPFGASKNRDAAWKSFTTVQALWDTAMARRAVEARVVMRRPVVILAGSGHVEHGWGIASRLGVLDPQGQRLLIMPWRGSGELDKTEADIFFPCPATKRARLGLTLESKDFRILVVAVEPGSKADVAGLKPGDELVRVQDAPIHALTDLHAAAIKAFEQDGILRLEVMRAGHPLALSVSLVDPKTGS